MSDTAPTLVLDYAPPAPRVKCLCAALGWVARQALRAAVSLAAWAWTNRHHLSGVAAAAVAAAAVYRSFDARVILSTPVWGGCGAARQFAYFEREWSRLALFAIPLLWCGARRSPWAARVARTSFTVAVLWWHYMRYPTHGHRAWLGA